MSDHEAVTFNLSFQLDIQQKHKVFLFHKGTISAIKDDMLKFQGNLLPAFMLTQ